MNRKNYPLLSRASYYEQTPEDYLKFCSDLSQLIKETAGAGRPIVLLCIGSDRITGDCLGPLVGHKIHRLCPSYPYLFGTLKEPVHALNLTSCLSKVRKLYPDSFFIAVDASLGRFDQVGLISLSPCPLTPGEGVKKNLPSVGDISITGIVNTIYGNPGQKLSETRLHLVNDLAEFISTAICDCFSDRPVF